MSFIEGRGNGSPLRRLADVVSRVGNGGVAGEAPPGSSDAGDPLEQAALQIFPWWYYGPAGTQFYYVDTLVQTVGAGVADFPLANSELEVGKGQLGVIVAIALLVQSPTAADDFFYTLKRNNGPEIGLDRLRNFPVAAAFSLRDLNGYVVRLQPGDRMSWSVTNNGAAARDVSVSYLGWKCPVAEVERVQKGINY